MGPPSTQEARPHDAARFARHVSGYTAAVGASRVLGYIRDAGVLFIFGGGALTDAFYAAFRIANLFRRTLGEGALNSSFVPVLAAERLQGEAEARRFLGSLWSGVLLASGLMCAAGIVFARPLVLALTYGFRNNPELFALTVSLTRIFFVHVFLVILCAVCQGSLNVAKQFFLPALAPTAFSLCIIVYLGALRLGWLPPGSLELQMRGLAWVATLSGVIQLAVLWPSLRKAGMLPSLRPPLAHPGVFQVLALMGPSMVGMATDQFDTFVDTIIASFLEEGSLTAIYNSSRLMQLPLALFGVATAAVALPHLSERASRGEMKEFGQTLNSALRMLAFILLPAGAGLILLSLPVVRLLFEHGKFTHANSLMTSAALQFYCLGLLAYAGTKVLVSSFYSLREAKTPVKIAVVEAALNAVLSLLFMGRLRVAGLALASALAAWLGCGLNFRFLDRQVGFSSWAETFLPMGRSLAATFGMSAAVWGALALLGPVSPLKQVAAGLLTGVPVYFALAALLDIEERHLFWQFLKRRTS